MSSLWHRFMLKYRNELRSPHMSRTLLELLLKEMGEQVSSLETSVTTLEGDVAALEALIDVRGRTLTAYDLKAANTPGGTFTSGAWRTRDLNQLIQTSGTGANLVANQLVLPAGTWEIWATSPAANGIVRHQTRLFNVTSGNQLQAGSSEAQGGSTQTRSFVSGVFEFAVDTTIELQHQCNTTVATSGFGLASNFGTFEVYSILAARRLA